MTDKYEAQRRMLLSNPNWAGISNEVRKTLVEAEITLGERRSKRNIDDWMLIGHACFDLQQAALRRSNSTNANGRRYADAYNLLAPLHLRDMDTPNRRKAIQLYQNGEEIRAWYFDKEINSESDRNRMQHPQTILAKFDPYHKQRALKAGDRPGEPGNVGKPPDEERRKCTQAAAIADAVHDMSKVGDDAAERLGSGAPLMLDLTPEGRLHSWETLIGVYGFDPVIDLFKLGLDRSEPRLLGDHIDELLDIVEAIALQIEDENAAWEEDEGKADEPGEAALGRVLDTVCTAGEKRVVTPDGLDAGERRAGRESNRAGGVERRSGRAAGHLGGEDRRGAAASAGADGDCD
jgi:hypothetical protein